MQQKNLYLLQSSVLSTLATIFLLIYLWLFFFLFFSSFEKEYSLKYSLTHSIRKNSDLFLLYYKFIEESNKRQNEFIWLNQSTFWITSRGKSRKIFFLPKKKKKNKFLKYFFFFFFKMNKMALWWLPKARIPCQPG